jgi:hypothetical protein
MECNLQKNNKNCNCSYPCVRHGKCCDCIEYHRKKGQLPACYFNEKYEKTYDRSISNYQKMLKEG